MATAQNILILSSNTGGGHGSAAQALQDSLITLAPGQVLVKITQVLEESSTITRLLADFYNYLLRHRQDWMKHYYWLIHQFKLHESRLLFQAALNYGQQAIDRHAPEALVSVHPMLQHFFAYALKKLNLSERIPLYTIVTDPCSGFWNGWACEDVQQYYVVSHDAKQQLVDYGIHPERVRISGMPVSRQFHPVEDSLRREYRQALGLDPDRMTVFLNAGWAGGGNIGTVSRQLAQIKDTPIQAIFLAGRHDRLVARAHRWAQEVPFPVKVLGYTPQIDRLMKASDLMVSKLGGLTTFEAMACHLPILGDAITPPMPQEAQTARFIETTGAGLLLRKPTDIVSVIQSIQQTPERLAAMRLAARQHSRQGAADHIAEDLLRQIA